MAGKLRRGESSPGAWPGSRLRVSWQTRNCYHGIVSKATLRGTGVDSDFGWQPGMATDMVLACRNWGFRMPRVACLMMQKDEGELLRTWIEYHRGIFGKDNLFIYDNASTDVHTLNILKKYSGMGYSIDYQFTHNEAHLQKGKIFGNKIMQLEDLDNFDFFIPLDCDEFFVLRKDLGITTNKEEIHAELDALMDRDEVLSIDTAFYNIPNRPDYFLRWSHRKTFFRSGTFGSMDAGFHEGTSRKKLGRYETLFAHMHFHHKPYDILVEHAKNKLRPTIDPDNQAELNDPKNRNRLTDFITQGEDVYMERFQNYTGIHLPEFQRFIRNTGIQLPF